MPFTRIHSVSLLGFDALSVEVEVDISEAPVEKTSLIIVGLPDAAVKESKDRVMTAIKNTGYPLKNIYCVVNLAPGDLRKEGPMYDLPIALGLLASAKSGFQCPHLADFLIVGELGLSGETRPVSGAIAMAMLAKEMGKKGVLLPWQNASEAAVVEDLNVYGIRNLKEAWEFCLNPASLTPAKPITLSSNASIKSQVDFADISGQEHVKRALEIAAAGGHNIVLSGPPGSGKTMLAKAMVSIMPELSLSEALEVTKIHSVGGLLKEGSSLINERPFRSPHHTVSNVGLIGGGSSPRPGEVSFAHRGILFLDELPEFSRTVLEVLRQPLEDRCVTISRAQGHFTFPTNFICVAAMNPCPCGYLGHPEKPCKDTPLQVQRYRAKISGPFWDRMDMHLEVPALKYKDLIDARQRESSAAIRRRVEEARKMQHLRFKKEKLNSEMSPKEIKSHIELDASCQIIMGQAMEAMGLSARVLNRLLKVSLTIADLAQSPLVKQEHLLEALSYRQLTS